MAMRLTSLLPLRCVDSLVTLRSIGTVWGLCTCSFSLESSNPSDHSPKHSSPFPPAPRPPFLTLILTLTLTLVLACVHTEPQLTPSFPPAAQETVGSYTSTDMQNAGSADKQAAIDEMRAAKQVADEQGGGVSENPTLGKVEKSLGSVTGCEGMEEEGAKRLG